MQRYSSLDENSSDGEGSSDGGRGDDEIDDDSRVQMEDAFGWIFDRIVSQSQQQKNPSPMIWHRPFEVVVIEHTPSSCQSVVHTFEQNTLCPCRQQQQNCNCYITQLTIMNNAIQSTEKPLEREVECWDLAVPAEHHHTQLVMKQNGAIVKMGESLWDWRSRIMDIQERDNNQEVNADGNDIIYATDTLCQDINNVMNVDTKKKKPWRRIEKLKASNKRCIMITFRGIRQPIPTTVPSKEMNIAPEVKPSKVPLSKLLTIIITTSPIRSNPSTEMLENTFATFPFAGSEFAHECPKVIVCDGYRVLNEDNDREEKKDESRPPPKITRKYVNSKQNLRNGIATTDQAKNYTEFKIRLRQLCDEANGPTQTKNPFRNTHVVELDERHGYGFALRHALYHCVDTPYVCVIQHDRTFMRPTPIKEVVGAMEIDSERIKYVGMSMRSVSRNLDSSSSFALSTN